ncbi:hypothetical protein GCM10025771_02710 [Niveibacterium umoris]|uniref:Uncharacterized protein n=1 Tax=Niveibacterium umoris TaxID=1193620 RepID=A0A840BV24_9RHOO|nr:hypothetical protein [Niveibacterium umoris]MBB4014187.1 hypothetical protein [Niveibacterium umoris]
MTHIPDITEDHADLPYWVPKPGKMDTAINAILMAGWACFGLALFLV